MFDHSQFLLLFMHLHQLLRQKLLDPPGIPVMEKIRDLFQRHVQCPQIADGI